MYLNLLEHTEVVEEKKMLRISYNRITSFHSFVVVCSERHKELFGKKHSLLKMNRVFASVCRK